MFTKLSSLGAANPKAFDSDTVSPHILYDFYIGNEAAREEAELKEAAR